MSVTCTTHRRPCVQPVRAPADALSALLTATEDGTLPAVVVACLDAADRPLAMLIVEDCPPDQAGSIVDFVLDAAATDRRRGVNGLASLILTTSRPGTDPSPTPDEVALWPELQQRVEAAGLALWEWFVVADGEVRAIGGGP